MTGNNMNQQNMGSPHGEEYYEEGIKTQQN